MSIITIDIETVPGHESWIKDDIVKTIAPPGNIKKPESKAAWMKDKAPAAIEEKYHSCGLNAATGEIICIGYKVDTDEDGIFDYRWGSETNILFGFFRLIDRVTKEARRPVTLVGHNLIAFDMPYIYRRALVNSIRPPSCIKPPADLKAWSDGMFDTMIEWSGIRDKISLDKLCKVLGIEGKTGMDGSMVYQAYLDGKLDEISEYCQHDVEITRAIYDRLTFS
jgi:hypothetical protein